MATKEEILSELQLESKKSQELKREVRKLKRLKEKEDKKRPEPTVEELETALARLKQMNAELETEKTSLGKKKEKVII